MAYTGAIQIAIILTIIIYSAKTFSKQKPNFLWGNLYIHTWLPRLHLDVHSYYGYMCLHCHTVTPACTLFLSVFPAEANLHACRTGATVPVDRFGRGPTQRRMAEAREKWEGKDITEEASPRHPNVSCPFVTLGFTCGCQFPYKKEPMVYHWLPLNTIQDQWYFFYIVI